MTMEEVKWEYLTLIRTPAGIVHGMQANALAPNARSKPRMSGRSVSFWTSTDVRALFDLAINSKLRGCDVVKMKIGDFVFPSRVDYLGHISTREYSRLVDKWVDAIGLNVKGYDTHSLRRTKASMIYKATGNLRAV